jgi:hypothetical protein
MAKQVNRKQGRKKPKSVAKKVTKAKVSSANKKAKKKSIPKRTKIFIYALAIAALGGGGYLVYDKLKRRKQNVEVDTFHNSSDRIVINNNLPASFTSPVSKVNTKASDSFPLKRGSRGERVKELQRALAKYKPDILIDGQFGSQTAGALQAAGFASIVDEATFNKIVGNVGSMTLVFNPSKIAFELYNAAQRKELQSVLRLLSQIKSVADYSSVNTYYKRQSFISKTIVTDLLEFAFKSNEQAKSLIKKEFVRIGLKVSSNGVWSLQGIKLHQDLIAIRQTIVLDGRGNRIPVKRNTILGDELKVANGYTWFKSIDQNILKVPTQDVTYI